jgi:hypothetical protein
MSVAREGGRPRLVDKMISFTLQDHSLAKTPPGRYGDAHARALLVPSCASIPSSSKRLRNSGLWVLLLGLLKVLKPHEAGCMTGPATRIAEARAQQGKKDTTVGSPSRRAE